jgi:hypothetical protein
VPLVQISAVGYRSDETGEIWMAWRLRTARIKLFTGHAICPLTGALQGDKGEPSMERDAATSARLAGLRRHLESVSGQQINVSDEQLIEFITPVSLSSAENDTVLLSGSSPLPETVCLAAGELGGNVWDVSSSSSTDANGECTLLLSDFLCTPISPGDPISLVVTPNTPTPCYATMTRTVIGTSTYPFTDLQIIVRTWHANGHPAPKISFDWRCRLFAFAEFETGGLSKTRFLVCIAAARSAAATLGLTRFDGHPSSGVCPRKDVRSWRAWGKGPAGAARSRRSSRPK